MIIDFDDTCWSHEDNDWQCGLIELLVLLAIRQQHSLWATPEEMLPWCSSHLTFHVEYFKTRLAAAQPRSNALTIRISPNGATEAAGTPPWSLTARAAQDLVNRPLRVVLENDQSDRMFVEATVPAFSHWCERNWIAPTMGGGSAMKKDIDVTSSDVVARWRTFYLFDSDRLHQSELDDNWRPPAGDGCEGYNLETACANMPSKRWHRLNRRSIENYLPYSLLSTVNSTATSALFSSSVGGMAHFYNIKTGLAGDGVFPPDPKKIVRASRCQGFWSLLSPDEITALQDGFGKGISDEFKNVPECHSWPADVISEMNALAEALQDAM